MMALLVYADAGLCALSANMPVSHHLPLKNHAHQPSYLKAIMPISHLPPPFSQYANKPSSAYKNYAYQPSCNPSMMPICHNPPPRLIEPINHWAYQPSSLLTLALLSRLLSLSACLVTFKIEWTFWDVLETKQRPKMYNIPRNFNIFNQKVKFLDSTKKYCFPNIFYNICK